MYYLVKHKDGIGLWYSNDLPQDMTAYFRGLVIGEKIEKPNGECRSAYDIKKMCFDYDSNLDKLLERIVLEAL